MNRPHRLLRLKHRLLPLHRLLRLLRLHRLHRLHRVKLLRLRRLNVSMYVKEIQAWYTLNMLQKYYGKVRVLNSKSVWALRPESNS